MPNATKLRVVGEHQVVAVVVESPPAYSHNLQVLMGQTSKKGRRAPLIILLAGGNNLEPLPDGTASPMLDP